MDEDEFQRALIDRLPYQKAWVQASKEADKLDPNPKADPNLPAIDRETWDRYMKAVERERKAHRQLDDFDRERGLKPKQDD